MLMNLGRIHKFCQEFKNTEVRFLEIENGKSRKNWKVPNKKNWKIGKIQFLRQILGQHVC
jgi:hypothetical protein|nr:MAG TPA: hypothetical protein [Caudoviricetes sp.]